MPHDKTSKRFDTLMRNAFMALAAVAVFVLCCGTIAFAAPSGSDITVDLGASSKAATAQASHSAGTSSDAQESTSADTAVKKSEMVYVILEANGSVKETYVVNRFDSDSPQNAEDYGAYTQVSNLTTTQSLACENSKVTFDMGADPFFYQGTLEHASLPWNVSLSYTLDGHEVTPEALAGSSGQLEISITTNANPQVNSAFYDSFMLQVTFTLDGSLCTDIEADGATLAASGKDHTVAFTVLPGHDGSFKLSAKVKDFEMPSVQIAALPYSSVIEMPDTSEMESGLNSLSDAVSQLNAGTSELANGVAQLASGAEALADGAVDFGDGLSQLAGSSEQIVGASAQIRDALSQISDALEEVDLSNIDDLAKFSPVLREIAQILQALKVQVQGLDDGYARMAEVMDYLASIIHQNPLSDEEIAAMREAVADDETAAAALEKLLTSYYAVQAAIDEYYASGGSPATIEAQLREIFEDGGDLDQAIDALNASADFIDDGGIDQLKQMVTGMQRLSGAYDQFHDGLVAYTDGVKALDENYSALSSGMSELADGTSQLSDGASQLSSGIAQLDQATRNLPNQMRKRMGDLMADYEFPEFDPVSFVDERNENVVAVQFVMLTDPIEKPKPEPAEPEPEPELTMWDRFLAVIGM